MGYWKKEQKVSSMKNIFYKKRLTPTESGLEVITDKWVSIHETPCFHFCVAEWRAKSLTALKRSDETELQYARRLKMLKRIHKSGSRFAFDTEEKALEHLRFLKRKQLGHMERDVTFIKYFLECDTLKPADRRGFDSLLVPGSKSLVNQHFVFD